MDRGKGPCHEVYADPQTRQLQRIRTSPGRERVADIVNADACFQVELSDHFEDLHRSAGPITAPIVLVGSAHHEEVACGEADEVDRQIGVVNLFCEGLHFRFTEEREASAVAEGDAPACPSGPIGVLEQSDDLEDDRLDAGIDVVVEMKVEMLVMAQCEVDHPPDILNLAPSVLFDVRSTADCFDFVPRLHGFLHQLPDLLSIVPEWPQR